MKTRFKRLQAPNCRSGFTLVELMIVIVIIIVLVGIGAPLASKMRSRADDSKCVNNVRNWGNAVSLFMADNAGMIEAINWNSIGGTDESAYVTYLTGEESHAAGYKELAKMRCCPALKGKDAISGNGNSYSAYSFTDPNKSSQGKKTSKYTLAGVKNPSRFVIMIEVTNVGSPATIKAASDYTSKVQPLTQEPKMRHKDGVVNALMGDFSVKTLNWKEISKNVTIWTTF